MSTPDQLLTNACTRLGFDSNQVFAALKADTSEGNRTTIIHHMFSLTEKPREHTVLAGAIAMYHLYQKAPTDLQTYVNVFRNYLRPEVINFFEQHMPELQAAAEKQFKQDFNLSYFSAGTFISTYLSRLSSDQEPMEIPQFCWLRIAVGEFLNYGLKDALNMYHRYSNQQCIPASPTIFNMGMRKGAPSSCMIYTMGDSLEDIYEVKKELALASKNNAGSGVDLSGLRHSQIGRHGISKGIIPLGKTLDWDTIYVNQGSRRPGALTMSTRVHHYDTYEFIGMVDKTKKDQDRFIKANTSIMLSDLFMKRCLDNGKWTLFCPKQTYPLNEKYGQEFEQLYLHFEQKAKVWNRYLKYCELQKLPKIPHNYETMYEKLCAEFKDQSAPEQIDSREYNADTLMNAICDMQIKSGMPYIVHGCNTNRKNNMCNVGPVRSMNLCQEIAIPAVAETQTGCCNLGSLSLVAFVKTSAEGAPYFDFKEFGQCVQDQVRALNCVIDSSLNISDKALKSNQENRPIGIGVNGFADMCHKLDIPPVDPNHIPTNNDTFMSWNDLSQTPNYASAALLERQLNPELKELNYKIWSCMYYHALAQSNLEAQREGAYVNFWTSPTAQGHLQYHLWQQEATETGREYPFKLEPVEPAEWGQEGTWAELIANIKSTGLRNALLLTCMPTASSAQLVGNCESTEFHMQNIYTRKVLSGDYPVMNFDLVHDLQEIGLWSIDTYNHIVNNNGTILQLSEDGLDAAQKKRLRWLKEKYLTMWEIPQKIIIQLAAQRQVFIDHSQSMNIYLARPQKEILKSIHTITWKYGLKTGIYYLRSRAANDALKIGQAQKARQENTDSTLNEIQQMVDNAKSASQKQLEEKRQSTIKQALLKAGVPKNVNLSESADNVCELGTDCINCQ